ncbi:MAG: VWA domain-containing protein [Chloroflexia bacterium]|nr:VWA domain-containing protein [Chloroflexia bacterium]
MAWTIPAALALLILAVPIIMLYLLRLRREDRPVSSILLWQSLLRDLEANAPWQRLQRNLLLFLQLAALLALVLALAGPYLPSSRLQGSDLLLIVDTSASMAASDLRPSRLEAARQQAQRLAGRLSPQGRVTLIAAGGVPRVLLSGSSDPAALRSALGELQAAAASSDLTAALRLAATLAAESPGSEVVLLSDGHVELEAALSLPAPFRFIPLGQSDFNQGIVVCSLAPAAGRLDLFVRVRNFAPVALRRRLDLYVDGALLTARYLDLPARSDLALSYALPDTIGLVEARLSDEDELALDDVAWAVPPAGSQSEAILVTEGNRFLQTGLGLLPGVALVQVSPNGFADWWTARQEQGIPPALLIFDAFVPEQLPETNLFFLAPPTSTEIFQVSGVIESPRLRPAREDDPLLRYVDVNTVAVRQSQSLVRPAWARVVLEDEQGRPQLLLGETGGRQVAILAFDLHDSDLPLQVAFPLLLANLVEALAPPSGGDLPTRLAPGEPLVVQGSPQMEEIRIRPPDGREVRLPLREGRAVWEETTALGVYEVSWWGDGQEWGRARTVVALLSAEEGDIAPRAELPQPVTAELSPEQEAQQGRRPLGRILALLALGLLLIEWAVAHRGGLLGLLDLPRRLRRNGQDSAR